MVKVLAPFAVLVGVCPHRPAMELRELLRQCGLDIAQLPAVATVEDCRLLRQRFRLIKRVSLPADGTVEGLRKQLGGLAGVVDGVLLDLPPAGLQAVLRDAAGAGPPVVVGLGQGLEPLAELLRRFRPYAVDAGPALDLADQPGHKDPRLVRRLLRTIRWETRRPVVT